MKCSFCLCDKEPSKEHIIPYALGGSLTTYSVCKDCNSSLGSTIDGKFIDNIFNRLSRCQTGLAGQNGGRIRSIYDHSTGELKDCGVVFHGDHDGQPNVKQKIDVEVSGEEVRVNAVFPTWADSKRIKGSIKSAVFGKLKEADSKADESVLLKQAEKIADDAYLRGIISTSKDVTIHETINLDDLTLAFMKMSYEIACEEFGEPYYAHSRTAGILRGAIRLNNAQACIHGQVFISDSFIKSVLDKASDGTNHVIILLGGAAIISVFGICSVIRYEESDKRFMPSVDSAPIFLLDYKKRTNSRTTLLNWFSSHDSLEVGSFVGSICAE